MTVAPSAWGIRNTELSKRGYNVSIIYCNSSENTSIAELFIGFDFRIRFSKILFVPKNLGKSRDVPSYFGVFGKLFTEKCISGDT